MTEADTAAARWGGTITRLIRARENAVYDMALPDGRAALRLHRRGYQGDAAIRSELWWCDALAAAGLPISTPILSQSGALLERLDDGGTASAIRWIDGDPLGEAGVPFPEPVATQLDRHHALGQLLAQVHRATDALTLPDGFVRPRWDIDGLVGETPFWGRFWDHPAATDDQRDVLCAARAYLTDVAQNHAAQGGDFGLIHADVLRENVFVGAGGLSLIDFDDSGFGFRLYDLGTVMSQNQYEPARDDLRDALMEGYGTTDLRMVEAFTMARTLASVGWTMPRLAPDDRIHRSHIARAVMCARRVMGA